MEVVDLDLASLRVSTCNKIKTYSQLFDFYNGDIKKVISKIHVSKPTLLKYLKIKNLSLDILSLLDTSSQNKITLNVAVELTKLPEDIDKIEVLTKLSTLTNNQKQIAIKYFVLNSFADIHHFDEIKENVNQTWFLISLSKKIHV
jgi:hypothetical protein